MVLKLTESMSTDSGPTELRTGPKEQSSTGAFVPTKLRSTVIGADGTVYGTYEVDVKQICDVIAGFNAQDVYIVLTSTLCNKNCKVGAGATD